MPKHGSFALAGVLVAAFMLFDQSSAIHVLQGADGTLYLAQDSDAWTMQPGPISDGDLAALTPSGELDGAIPAPFLSTSALAPLQAVQSADGSLYLVQGSNVWTLVPLAASDGDIAALNVVGSLSGTIAAPGLTGPAADPPPPAAEQPPVPAQAAPLPAPPVPQPIVTQPETSALTIVSSLPRQGADNKRITDSVVNAMRMALNEHNNQVLGQPLAYVDLDGSTRAKQGWDAAQEASNANQALSGARSALAYIGPLDSGAAVVSIPILCSGNMAMVSPGVTGIEFTRPQAGVPNAPEVFYPNNCKRNFARLSPADDLEHAASSDWPNQLNAKGRQWYQAYMSQFGAAPDIHALYGYEAMNVVLSAIQHAGSTNRAAIRDALFSTSNFDGVLGTWSMTSTGDTTRIQAPPPGSR
jgi:ABC-type branched-subunit amino acid transport system substrate-binding protein